ncbi:uncharacterized protein CDV56_100039 [Aspergillus thermomutatus]|uniref:Uncharacterized protein n=1 Tax=Aspergillus thermomutatus TaxID=41047 RepID=A0A397G6Z6_ASPTH|nr:uncharacterized protein CDV56_100039 [Aspergillus thermomutatus]RHZ43880.1 hypothetical protein CDV56_100039 [Aspergillus thermomutatus]
MPSSAGRVRWRSPAAWRSDISGKSTSCGWPGTVVCSEPIPQLPIHRVWCCSTCGTYLSSSARRVREHHHQHHPTIGRDPPWQVDAQRWFANSRYCQYWIVGVPSAQPQDPPPVQPTSATTTPSLPRMTQPTLALTEPSILRHANEAPESGNG